jgi:hypothetical protein
VPGAKASGGPRGGPAGTLRRPAPRQGAVSAAAPLGLRSNEPGQNSRARLATPQANGTARRRLAPPRARAVECLRTRTPACDMQPCLRAAARRAGAPTAALATQRMRLKRADGKPPRAPAVPGERRRGRVAVRPPLGWAPRSGAITDGGGAPQAAGCSPAPAPAPHWRAVQAPPALGVGRAEGPQSWRGRSGSPQRGAALGTAGMRAPHSVWGAATRSGPPDPETKSAYAPDC